MIGIIAKVKRWFHGETSKRLSDAYDYANFRHEVHDSRNLRMQVAGSTEREKRASDRMRQVSEDAIAAMERERDGDDAR